MVQPLWKIFWYALIKLTLHLSCDPAIPPADIYARGMNAYAQNVYSTFSNNSTKTRNNLNIHKKE